MLGPFALGVSACLVTSFAVVRWSSVGGKSLLFGAASGLVLLASTLSQAFSSGEFKTALSLGLVGLLTLVVVVKSLYYGFKRSSQQNDHHGQ